MPFAASVHKTEALFEWHLDDGILSAFEICRRDERCRRDDSITEFEITAFLN